MFDDLSQEIIKVVQNKKDFENYSDKSLKTKTTVSKKRRSGSSKLVLQVDSLARKICRVVQDFRNRKFREKDHLLEENLASFSQNSFVNDLEKEEQEEIKECNEEKEEEETEKPKENVSFRKNLGDLKDFNFVLERTKDFFKYSVKEAARQGCDLTELVGVTMYRYLYVHNRPLAYQMLQLFKTGTMACRQVAMEKSLAILERRRLSKEGFRSLRRILQADGLRMPPYEEVAKLRLLITPPLKPHYHNSGLVIGVCTSMKDSLSLTVRRMLQAGQIDFLESVTTNLVGRISVGTDGAGGQSEHRQKSGMGISSTHTLSCLYQLTEIAVLETSGEFCLDRFCNPDHRKDCMWCPKDATEVNCHRELEVQEAGVYICSRQFLFGTMLFSSKYEISQERANIVF